eukprot:COSAG04_NODE_16371_length_501_cov_0.880597_1_plen_47_part_00
MRDRDRLLALSQTVAKTEHKAKHLARPSRTQPRTQQPLPPLWSAQP